MAENNSFVGIGKLTKDAMLSYVGSKGTALTKFGLAIESAYKKNGTCFIDIVAWQELAESCQYFEKGNTVKVEGELKLESWEDKNGGGKRYKHSIVASSVELIGGKKGNPANKKPEPEFTPPEDDIPFAWAGLLILGLYPLIPHAIKTVC